MRHAAGNSPDAITCGDTRAGADQNRWPAMFAIARSGENRISIVMKKTVKCGEPPQPEPAPKRRRIVACLNEDPVFAPLVEHAANDELSSAIRDFVHENWASVRTHVVNGPVQCGITGG